MKYEIKASIKWTIKSGESKEFVQQKAFDELTNAIRDLHFPNIDLEIKAEELKSNIEIQRIKEYSWSFILDKLKKTNNNFKVSFQGKEYIVKMNSQRYFLFRENNKCVCCGIEGTKVILEKNLNDVTPHFNLYAKTQDGLVLLTKDHITPKCVGGTDRHSNYQTMCSICNGLKGHSNISIENLHNIRKIYEKNKYGDKKALHNLIDTEKMKFSTKINTQEYQSQNYIKSLSKDAIKTRCDLSVYKDKEKYIGISMYDSPKKNLHYVGNIRRGIYLEPLFSYKKKYECQIYNNMIISIHKSLLRHK